MPDTRPRVLETFLTLVHFNTPSRSETAAASWTADYLREIGFDVTFDDAHERLVDRPGAIGNLFAFKKGSLASASGEPAPGIFFSSHFDTVEPTPGLEVKIDGDILSSASDTILGADDKCGMAPILEAVKQLHESGEAHGDIQLVLTICEEIGLRGARLIDPDRLRAQYGFVLDSGPPVGEIVRSAPSQVSFKIKIVGKPAHAGAEPENGISAIVAASKAIAALKLGRIDFETTANIGIIRGGSGRNIVPAEVELIGEARSRDQGKLDAQVAHMVETIEREAAAFGAKATIDVTLEYPAYRLSETDPVIRIAARAAEAAGLSVGFADSGGGSDANIFNGLGVPTCVLATGMEKVHTHDEFCRISDLEKDVAWIREIIREAARTIA